MKRKKSPLQHHKGGTSTDSSDSSKLSSHQSSNVLMSSPAVLHPPSFYVGTPPSLGAASSHPAVNNSVDEWSHMDDIGESEAAHGLSGSLPSLGSNDGLHFALDETDLGSSHTPDLHRTKAAIEHIHQKIARTKELIKAEQKARDENVNEYLKLATNADKQQLQRIKSVFEKKNQKSAQLITQLQKKLENYNKRIRELETHGLPRGVLRDMGQGLKDVGANIKGGISGLSGGVVGTLKGGRLGRSSVTHIANETVMAKPREFAHLIKKQFGSADNINSIPKSEENEEPELNIHGSALSTHRYTSDEENSSVTSESAQNHNAGDGSHQPLSSPHHHSMLQTLPSAAESATIQCLGPASVDLEPILHELRSQRDEYQHLVEEIESVKVSMFPHFHSCVGVLSGPFAVLLIAIGAVFSGFLAVWGSMAMSLLISWPSAAPVLFSHNRLLENNERLQAIAYVFKWVSKASINLYSDKTFI